ncbi:unnamed protein product, partial [Rotaria socialis]
MTNFVTVQRYVSSSESHDEMEINQQDIQEKRKVRSQMAIKQEKQWSRYYTNRGYDGIKVHHRCNQVQFRGKKCNAALHLHYPTDTDEVVLFRGANKHDHTNSIHRKKIHQVLQDKNFRITFNQLKNYLIRLREKKFGPSTSSLGELESLCIEKSTVPQADDEPFVLSYNVTYEDDDDD